MSLKYSRYASAVLSSASSTAALQAVAEIAWVGQTNSAGGNSTTAAAHWLPVATASGGTPVRRRLVKLADQPYSSVAPMQASTAQPVWSAPGLNEALSQASHSTPAKPITRPTMRHGVSRSRSHSQAISAPHSGVVALNT